MVRLSDVSKVMNFLTKNLNINCQITRKVCRKNLIL